MFHAAQTGGGSSGMKQHTTRSIDFEAQALPQLEDLYCTALYVLDNESEAQGLVQESFALAYRNWDKHECGRDRRVWLFRIMANALSSKYRPSPILSATISEIDEIDRHTLHPRLIDQWQINKSEQSPLSMLSRDDVKNAIRNLPNNSRLIVVLSLLAGFSYQEIADIAGTNLETVRSRLYQGRALMQRELFDHAACEGDCRTTADRVRSRRTG